MQKVENATSQKLLEQTFGDWMLILNDDKWEHTFAENDPEEKKRREKMERTTRKLGAHRNALGTFHHDQKHCLMTARKAWFKCEKIGRSDCWVRLFSLVTYVVSATKNKKKMKRCGHGWFLSTRQKR